ncbi:transposase, partial [Enterococcus faecium]|uniref:transposase n=1 Tax=Enterococcus faecium TaxID=1352 RepID=UPI000AA7102A
LMTDVLYIKVREDHQVLSKSCHIAIGITEGGDREIIGFMIQNEESDDTWSIFFEYLKEYGFYQGTEHRTIKYLNNLIEQDHRPVKRRNKFYRSLRTASTTIKGMEAIRGLYKKTRKEGTLFGFSVCTEIKVLLGIPA